MSKSYKESLHRSLADREEAVAYLQAALEDSQAAFLTALKNVVDARNVTAVAQAAQLDRVHLYRMLSSDGNPTFTSLDRVLHALGLKLAISIDDTVAAGV